MGAEESRPFVPKPEDVSKYRANNMTESGMVYLVIVHLPLIWSLGIIFE